MIFSLYKWQNTPKEHAFNSEEFFITNGFMFKLKNRGLIFMFNKSHVSLSVFSSKVMYDLGLAKGKKLDTSFKEYIVFQRRVG